MTHAARVDPTKTVFMLLVYPLLMLEKRSREKHSSLLCLYWRGRKKFYYVSLLAYKKKVFNDDTWIKELLPLANYNFLR